MKKQLTDRQLWAIWKREYNLWMRAGYSHSAAVLKADAAVAAKRLQMREAAEADAPDAEKRPG